MFKKTLLYSLLAASLAVLPSAARAQDKPPLQTKRPDLNGVFVVVASDPDDPRVKVEDVLCGGAFCSIAARDYMRALLADPKNDARPLKQINADITAFNRKYVDGLLTSQARKSADGFDDLDDPVLRCVPSGFNYAAGPLPIKIEQHDDRVVVRYEFWNGERIVYLDGRDHPKDLKPSRFGHSIGWYDGQTLVVETVGIDPHITYWAKGIKSSERALVTERFTRSADGERLEIEKTFVDPLMLRRPLTTLESRLVDRKLELEDFQCGPSPASKP